MGYVQDTAALYSFTYLENDKIECLADKGLYFFQLSSQVGHSLSELCVISWGVHQR